MIERSLGGCEMLVEEMGNVSIATDDDVALWPTQQPRCPGLQKELCLPDLRQNTDATSAIRVVVAARKQRNQSHLLFVINLFPFTHVTTAERL